MSVHESEVVQGRIFYLPFEDLLPKDAVRRINYDEDLDGGPYDHPVVIVSRPNEERHRAHFMFVSTDRVIGYVAAN